jgi:ATP-binding cassette subfamily F protein uup
MPALIDSLEAERDGLYETLADPDFYREGGEKVGEAKIRIEELEKEITEAYKRWEFLESIGDVVS